MKKIFLVITVLSMLAVQASAVCSVTGEACQLGGSPQINEFNPNSINSIKKTTTFENFGDFNREDNMRKDWPMLQESQDYNSNCQFGICLPQSGRK